MFNMNEYKNKVLNLRLSFVLKSVDSTDTFYEPSFCSIKFENYKNVKSLLWIIIESAFSSLLQWDTLWAS